LICFCADIMDFRILGPVFMGWSLGANHAANVFGTAVSSSMVRYRTAVILTAVFVLIGSLLGGRSGIETLSGLTAQTANTAFIISVAAALTVFIMTFLHLPVSTSQTVIGAILAIGFLNKQIELQGLTKVFICWVGTPIGAAIIAFVLYKCISAVLRKLSLHFVTYDRLIRILLILAGVYGAYALGANNVANVTGVFYKAGALTLNQALLIGGASIGLGALTYSRNVMYTVGRRIIPLDAFSAFIAVLAQAITVHVYAIIGVPVSTTQAVVGAVLGIGFLKGIRTVSKDTVFKILAGWFITPVVGAAFCLLLYFFLSK